jgi:predicted metal-dependent enzyme (double-stranded beta helix superfamily)
MTSFDVHQFVADCRNVVWAPKMTIMPHNHCMWAVIGVYTGREDNIF